MTRAALAARFGATILAACAPGPAKTADAVAAGKIEAPPGVALEQACTPSGPELCFDAIDQNCNGVIDEGCGLPTGPVQFVIAWGDSAANVDLVVTDPTGARASPGSRTTPSGLRFEKDCPSEGCHGQNLEDVVFEGVDPPRGRYKVELALVDLKGSPSPVSVRFGARIGSRSYGADVSLGRGDERKTFTFEL